MIDTNYVPGPYEVGSKVKIHGRPYTEITTNHIDGKGFKYSILGPVALVPGHHEEAEATAKLMAKADLIPEALRALNAVYTSFKNRGFFAAGHDKKYGNAMAEIIKKLSA